MLLLLSQGAVRGRGRPARASPARSTRCTSTRSSPAVAGAGTRAGWRAGSAPRRAITELDARPARPLGGVRLRRIRRVPSTRLPASSLAIDLTWLPPQGHP